MLRWKGCIRGSRGFQCTACIHRHRGEEGYDSNDEGNDLSDGQGVSGLSGGQGVSDWPYGVNGFDGVMRCEHEEHPHQHRFVWERVSDYCSSKREGKRMGKVRNTAQALLGDINSSMLKHIHILSALKGEKREEKKRREKRKSSRERIGKKN